MGDVIYSANPFQAHLGAIAAILVFFVIGAAGIGMAFLRRNQRGPTRILTGALGFLLLVGGCIVAVVTFLSVSGGVRTISTRFDNKSVAYDNCGDNGETCARYVLTATSSESEMDFDVPEGAYNRAKVNTCYQVSYYPNGGLFGGSGSYQQIDSVMKIEVADPAACQ